MRRKNQTAISAPIRPNATMIAGPLCVLLVATLAAGTASAAPDDAGAAAPLGSGVTPVSDHVLLGRIAAIVRADKPGDRAREVGAMAAFNDPRTVAMLSYLARHEDSDDVAVAAVRSLGGLALGGRADALNKLAAISVAPRPATADAALTTLGTLAPSTDALAVLLRVARDRDLPSERRKHAIDVIRARFPGQKVQTPRLAGPAIITVVGGGIAGGYTLAAVGRWAKADSGAFFGGLTGALIGTGTGYLMGRELSLDRKAWYTGALGWGIVGGELLSGALIAGPSDEVRGTIGVVSELVLGFAAYRFADDMDRTAGDVALTHLSGLAGIMLGNAISELAYYKLGTRGRNGAVFAATAAAVGISTALGPTTQFSPGDRTLIAFTTFEGFWYGGFLADIAYDSPSEQFRAASNTDRTGTLRFEDFEKPLGERIVRDVDAAGMLLGTSVGFLTGVVVSQRSDVSHGDVAQMLVFGGYGKLLGAGLTLLGNADRNRINSAQLVGGGLGIALGAATMDSLAFSGGDVALVPIATTWGLFHGLAVGAWLQDRGRLKGDQFVGMSLTTGALFGVAAIAFAQEFELTNLQATMGSTGAFWGAWLSGWTAARANAKSENTLLAAAVGGDVGAALTAVLVSPVIKLDPMILAGASFGGLSLAGLGTLITAMGTDDDNALMTANIVGSAVGLVAGGLIARSIVNSRAQQAASAGSVGPLADDDEPWSLPAINAAPLMQDGRLSGVSLQVSDTF